FGACFFSLEQAGSMAVRLAAPTSLMKSRRDTLLKSIPQLQDHTLPLLASALIDWNALFPVTNL
ncbi:MAG: hypothetical protein PVH85_26230, partial [Desulfobacterales bacterium]